MGIVRPSISMMPMDDVASELRANKPGRNFMTKEDKSSDVDQVAGIDSELIAIAVSKDERKTVENSLKLGGRPASDYLDKEGGDKILGVTDELSSTYSNEIRNLKDEVYQLKSELTAKGIVDERKEYSGFTDAFKSTNIKYDNEEYEISTPISGNTDTLFLKEVQNVEDFSVGKKFVIRRNDRNTEFIVESTGVTESGKVTFTPSVDCLDNINAVTIHKTTGQYSRGAFSFSTTRENVADSMAEKYHTQTDDTNYTAVRIDEDKTGYAAYFKIPKHANGAAIKLGVRLSKVGDAGTLTCHIIKKDAIGKFLNITDAKNKGYVIASSDIITSAEVSNERFVTEREVSKLELGEEKFFKFFDSGTNSYPILNGMESNCIFLIEVNYLKKGAYWNLFVSSKEKEEGELYKDLQTNNKLYKYTHKEDLGFDDDSVQCITDKIVHDGTTYNENTFDLMFVYIARDIIEKDEYGIQEGLYSTKIILPEPINVSRIRFATTINREGCYYVDSHNNERTIFTLLPESISSHSPNDNRFLAGENIIIANQIAKIKRVMGNRIEFENPVNIDKRLLNMYKVELVNPENGIESISTRIPVYRMNYTISVKPSFIDWDIWDEAKGECKTTYIKETPIDLDLKTVAPVVREIKRHFADTRKSDRLLFEADFGIDANKHSILANAFDLEIHWKSPFSIPEINSFKDIADNEFKELIGRMHEINVIFDKVY